MKIAYFGLDLGLAVLEALVDNGHEVASVHYSLDDDCTSSRLADVAQAFRIPILAARPTPDTFSAFLSQEIDIVIVNGYPHRLPIGGTPMKGVNMHPTLLPEGRGPWPFPWTILKGLQHSGITTHKLIDAMDAGDILLQTVYPVEANETFDSLVAKYQIAAPRHIIKLLGDFDAFWHNATPQVGGSSWPDTTRRDCTLEWNSSISDLMRTVRAFGSSGCFAILNGDPLIIRSAESWRLTPFHAPGTIVPETSPALVVAVADGYLLIKDYIYE